jgi:hypothetical protein
MKLYYILKYSILSFTITFDLEEISFEIFNIFENNIISVELAKVLGGSIQQGMKLRKTISFGGKLSFIPSLSQTLRFNKMSLLCRYH